MVLVSSTGRLGNLVAQGLESLLRAFVHLGVLLRIGQLSLGNLLALVVGGTLGLAALLQSVQQLMSVT